LLTNVGKMLSNVAISDEALRNYCVGNWVGPASNWNLAV